MAEVSFTDPAFVGRLESLYLLARKVLNGSLQADRKSKKKGSGITFADYSEYQLGDDYRSIDWRIYAKFESLIIKLFEIEEDATIYLVVDSSPSMKTKFRYARELAAALGYIALNSLDRLCVVSMADRIVPILDPCRGRGNAYRFLQSLDEMSLHGEDSDFTACAKDLQARRKRKGLVIVISDFLFPDGFDEGLRFLQWSRHDLFCLQVQDDTDRKCNWKGDLELTCAETGNHRKITVSPNEAKAYEAAVEAWNESLRTNCSRSGMGHVSTTPEVDFDTVIRGLLKRGGLVA